MGALRPVVQGDERTGRGRSAGRARAGGNECDDDGKLEASRNLKQAPCGYGAHVLLALGDWPSRGRLLHSSGCHVDMNSSLSPMSTTTTITGRSCRHCGPPPTTLTWLISLLFATLVVFLCLGASEFCHHLCSVTPVHSAMPW